MTAGNEKNAGQLVWEPPRLLRLTAPGDAAAACGGPGSGQAGDCVNIGSSATGVCYAYGSLAQAACSATGSSVVP